MTEEEQEIFDKWKIIKVGDIWILILLLLIWPFAIIYFFTRRWEAGMDISDVHEYHKYLEIKEKLKNSKI